MVVVECQVTLIFEVNIAVSDYVVQLSKVCTENLILSGYAPGKTRIMQQRHQCQPQRIHIDVYKTEAAECSDYKQIIQWLHSDVMMNHKL